MIGETGERKSAVATPDGKSRKKKKIHYESTMSNLQIHQNKTSTLNHQLINQNSGNHIVMETFPFYIYFKNIHSFLLRFYDKP